jgi:hypothetical protein
MSRLQIILFALFTLLSIAIAKGQGKQVHIDFYKNTFIAQTDTSVFVDLPQTPVEEDLKAAYSKIAKANFKPLMDSLLAYKNKYQLNDWLYYQLIRRVAQQISPKEENYSRYTFYKWFMMGQSGYDARLALSHQKIIFYVYNNEDISDIPYFMVNGKKFVCLNYHDYAKADLNADPPQPVNITIPSAQRSFSYKVTLMPEFNPGNKIEKKLAFVYDHKKYYFSVKLNAGREKAFTNYPGVDFDTYFNIPLSKEAYSSLIPLLKKNIKDMDQHKGVDYLMRFTRYAFLYENDQENFGREKRMSPEETLFSTYSDCDDRAALFYYLVKEIYNLPMIALLYPTHITMAVGFNTPVGEPIVYKGKRYSVCEPTPEIEDLKIGQLSPKMKNTPYQIVYQYDPTAKQAF